MGYFTVERGDFSSVYNNYKETGRKEIMKVIKIKELPEVTPANLYNMTSRWVVDESIGAKTMRISQGHLEPDGVVKAHRHENMEQLFIVLKGALLMKSEQEEVRIEEGEAVLIYPGESHATSADNEEADYLVVTGFNYS